MVCGDSFIHVLFPLSHLWFLKWVSTGPHLSGSKELQVNIFYIIKIHLSLSYYEE